MTPTDFGIGAAGGQPVVTADNFIRVESDAVFTGLVAQGGFGKFHHNREAVPPESRIVQRPNRDTLYSTGVFDLDAGPVTITLPDAGTRFMTMIVFDEDHYVFTVAYGAGTYGFSKEQLGTRWLVGTSAGRNLAVQRSSAHQPRMPETNR